VELRSQIRQVTLIVGLLCVALPSAAAAYCAGWDKTQPNYDPRYYSVDHELRRSQYVVKAKVLKETWIGEDGKRKPLQPPFQNGGPRPWGFDPYLGAFYELRVETVFKGKPPPTLRVFSENTEARFWLLPGEQILAFVSPGTFDAPVGKQLTLHTCGNFGFFPKAQRLIPAVLRASASARKATIKRMSQTAFTWAATNRSAHGNSGTHGN